MAKKTAPPSPPFLFPKWPPLQLEDRIWWRVLESLRHCSAEFQGMASKSEEKCPTWDLCKKYGLRHRYWWYSLHDFRTYTRKRNTKDLKYPAWTIEFVTHDPRPDDPWYPPDLSQRLGRIRDPQRVAAWLGQRLAGRSYSQIAGRSKGEISPEEVQQLVGRLARVMVVALPVETRGEEAIRLFREAVQSYREIVTRPEPTPR